MDEFKKRIAVEQSHMTPEPFPPDPDFMTCLNDLLKEIDKGITDEMIQQYPDLGWIYTAADRVKSAMEYDKPVVVVDSGNGYTGQLVKWPAWIIVEHTNSD